jgi:zinc transport system ATP-binding protein
MLLDATDVAFGYGDKAVVEARSLRLHAGECVGIFGPNGAGKTTLVRGITGLLPPLRGRIERTAGLRFGYLPQHRGIDLHWPMTGLDAATLAISAGRRFGWIGSATSRVRDAMAELDVSDLADRPFARLSGGQQQRLLLAGALAANTTALVLDEPTDGLDVRSRAALIDAIGRAKGKGLAVIIISHDIEDLLAVAEQVAWLHPRDNANEASRVESLLPHDFVARVTSISKAVIA